MLILFFLLLLLFLTVVMCTNDPFNIYKMMWSNYSKCVSKQWVCMCNRYLSIEYEKSSDSTWQAHWLFQAAPISSYTGITPMLLLDSTVFREGRGSLRHTVHLTHTHTHGRWMKRPSPDHLTIPARSEENVHISINEVQCLTSAGCPTQISEPLVRHVLGWVLGTLVISKVWFNLEYTSITPF